MYNGNLNFRKLCLSCREGDNGNTPLRPGQPMGEAEL